MSRGSTNVEWVRVTYCCGAILKKEVHTLEVDVDTHLIKLTSFGGDPEKTRT